MNVHAATNTIGLWEREEANCREPRDLFVKAIIGMDSDATPLPRGSHFWLIYNSDCQGEARISKMRHSLQAFCCHILICESLKSSRIVNYIVVIYFVFYWRMKCSICLLRVMDRGCHPGMGPAVDCHEPVSSSVLRGGCCGSTSLTDVEVKMTRLALNPPQLRRQSSRNPFFFFSLKALTHLSWLWRVTDLHLAEPVQFTMSKEINQIGEIVRNRCVCHTGLSWARQDCHEAGNSLENDVAKRMEMRHFCFIQNPF